VVIGSAASRAAPATDTPDPVLLRAAELLQEQLGLAPHECVADVLVACGLGDVLPDHVAACSARFSSQSAVPDVVVLRDRNVLELAKRAGLVDGNMWTPVVGARIPVVVGDDFNHMLSSLAQHLGKPVQAVTEPSRVKLSAQATKLLGVLGAHTGTGRLQAGRWTRSPKAPLTPAEVRAHLAGNITVAPFRPAGPWPFVVIDVDRHDALQEKYFTATCKVVKKLFPHAFEVESSYSDGRHFYVKLPPDVLYEQAALTVRAFLSMKGNRWLDEGRIRAERAEVPSHPVRLPFGAGSRIPASNLPLEDQLDKFISFVQRGKHADYDGAKQLVVTTLKFRGPWSVEKRNKLERFLAEEEVLHVAAKTLDAADPWKSILPSLSPPLQKVASSGAPAYGTRTRWTTELVTALSGLVGPDEARTLMRFWLDHRDHNSESLVVERDAVDVQTELLIEKKYKRAGVPVRFWRQAERALNSFFNARRKKNMFWPWLQDHINRPEEVPSSVRRTAFFILRKFYARGVRSRNIGTREFAMFVGKRHARDVERLLGEGTWMEFIRPYERGVRSRRYELSPSMWPPTPQEPRIFTLP
jgi:hypothetical protein